MSTIKNKEVAKKKAFPKRTAKKLVREVDMKLFVRDFYQKYGKMMSQLSHE
jgi:hypothetical protein